MYLWSAECMGSYGGEFVNAGVGLVGGCCGTTPEQIKAMKSALRMNDAKGKAGAIRVVSERKRESSITPQPLAQHSNLGRKLATGNVVTLAENGPPKWH